MKVAVMMAAYNTRRFVGAALASLLAQRQDVDLDIIVVNDGSTDGTGEIVRALAEEAPQIRLIETSNQGIVRTRNVLLDAVTRDTDLVTILDSDDLSPPGRFGRDAKPFADDPQLVAHYGFLRGFRDRGDDPLLPGWDGTHVDIRTIHLGAMLARTSLYRDVGRFDESFVQGEDTDYLLRMLELKPKLMMSDEICYFYRRHPANATRDEKTSRQYFTKALIAATRRRQADRNAGRVPPGFFEQHAFVNALDWWN